MDIEKFSQQITEEVKFHEVDMLGVCNNAVYLSYFEDARLKYLQNLSKKYKFKEFLQNESFVIIARNEIDYLNSSHLDDLLTVYTRIPKVSKSSFIFEHLVYRESDKTEIAKGSGVLVHINRNTKQSMLLPGEFHKAILDFEK
ncbi:MAG: hypothetical protein CR986_04805 [Ignavibacteriae bacterium]|nr:MAG: hypothetical protein CR986_04805 [Ignavibacteriota bacterium]